MTREEADKDVHIQLTLFRVAEKEYEEARKRMNHREAEYMKALQRRRETASRALGGET